MAKSSTRYVCSNCGAISLKYQGKCFECQSWGTLQETHIEPEPKKSREGSTEGAAIIQNLHDAVPSEFLRIMTVWSVIPMYLISGGLLGWGADYLLHTWPFGVAIGLLAGLVFAVRDSMRLRKEFHRPKEPTDGAAR